MASELQRRVGKRIAHLRKDRGWTQEVLAEKAGIGPSYLARIESGGRQPTLETIERVASALRVDAGDLFVRAPQRMANGSSRPESELVGLLTDLTPADIDTLLVVGRRLKHAARGRSLG